MRRIAHTAACLSMLILPLAARAADEMVDNPSYLSWSGGKPGTSVTLQSDVGMTGMNMKSETTHKLTEVTPESVTVEITTVVEVMGQKQNSPPQKMTIPAKVAKGKENVPPGVTGTSKTLDDEKVEVDGKTYTCHVLEFSGTDQSGRKASGKTWSSGEVPGQLVKMEMNSDGAPGGAVTMKMTLVKVDKK